MSFRFIFTDLMMCLSSNTVVFSANQVVVGCWWCTNSWFLHALCFCYSSNLLIFFYIYIYHTLLSKATYNCIQVTHFFFVSTCVPWESNPQPLVLLTQCSTTEPHRNTLLKSKILDFRIQIACFSLKVSSLNFILVWVCHRRMQDSEYRSNGYNWYDTFPAFNSWIINATGHSWSLRKTCEATVPILLLSSDWGMKL